MEERQLLTKKDIENMSLKEFVKFKSNPSKSVEIRTLMECDFEWIAIDVLENIETMKRLKEITIQHKEDLWHKIQHRKRLKNNPALALNSAHNFEEFCMVYIKPLAKAIYEIIKES